jgi:hypothetical protein
MYFKKMELKDKYIEIASFGVVIQNSETLIRFGYKSKNNFLNFIQD